MNLNWLLAFIPVAVGLKWAGAGPIVVFACSAAALIPLTRLSSAAIEGLAARLGPTYGGLLSASLGNAPEVIIGFFALRNGLVHIVKSSIIGSVIGNLLFTLGLAMFVGGVKNGPQRFNRGVAGMNAGLLLLTATGLIIPAVFHVGPKGTTRELSAEVSVILFLVYVASLIYIIVTSKPVTGKAGAELTEKLEAEAKEMGWSPKKSLLVLAAATAGLALMSELLTGAVEPATLRLKLTPTFAGIFVLGIVGNVEQIYNSIKFAYANKMDLTLGITVGSSIQVALFVAPVLFFSSLFLGERMDLLFNRFEIAAILAAVFIVGRLTGDGGSNWFEGLMLLAIYLILAFAFYYVPAQERGAL